MSHTNSASASKQPSHRAFVIRLIWDDATATWCIVLKSANGDETRLFTDMETAWLYLEALMMGQIAQNVPHSLEDGASS